jgi:hypothetical protein
VTHARAAPRLLHPRISRDPPSLRVVKRVILVALAIHVAMALLSGWRAWFQIRRLDLAVRAGTLQAGDRVEARVVSWARTFVDVRLELVQGAHAETLGTHLVPRNRDPASDPRPRSATLAVTLTPELLGRFRPGPAVVRATAIGRSQWLRVPPPMVREAPVTIAPVTIAPGVAR